MINIPRPMLADSYKNSMFLQLPDKTEYVFSYIESRGGHYDELVMFGTQALIKEYLVHPIRRSEVELSKLMAEKHGTAFNYDGWMYIVDRLKGKLPLHIRAVPEGTVVKNKNVMLTITNTDPKCAWLVTVFETLILKGIWYPTQVATTSYRIRNIIKGYLQDTTGNTDGLDFMLHDFGYRGCSSNETAMLGGMAHLVSFNGTDTQAALIGVLDYYDPEMLNEMPGFSINASEHSTMTAKGREGEVEQMRNMIKQFGKPGAVFACVSDGYDIFNACQNIWGGALKDEVIASGAKLVVRPDSGDPVSVVLKVVQILGDCFGYTVNEKGFKVLHPSVGVIQGDGVNELSISLILGNLAAHGWAASNVAYGMGGALLQAHTRDDNKWAMKCSAICVDGQWRDVYKDPITDKGKLSKKGILDLVKIEGVYKTISPEYTSDCDPIYTASSELVTVFVDGDICNEVSFTQIRTLARS